MTIAGSDNTFRNCRQQLQSQVAIEFEKLQVAMTIAGSDNTFGNCRQQLQSQVAIEFEKLQVAMTIAGSDNTFEKLQVAMKTWKIAGGDKATAQIKQTRKSKYRR